MGRFKVGQEIVCKFTPLPWRGQLNGGHLRIGPAPGELVHVAHYLPAGFLAGRTSDYVALKEYPSGYYYNEREFEPTVPQEVIAELLEEVRIEMETDPLFI
jgi:hypothetical protein